MHITGPQSSALLRRASRSTATRFHSSISNKSTPASPSPSPSSSPAASQFRSHTTASAAFRSFRSRWSHGVDWKSPASLSSQIRTTASPLLERFHRSLATKASENAFSGLLTGLPKPGGGEFGKFYSLPALNDPRIGNFHSRVHVKDTTFSSRQYGTRESKEVTLEGRVQFDLLQAMQRDYKLSYIHSILFQHTFLMSRYGILKVICCDIDENYTNSTANVVYKEVLFRL